MTAAPGTLDPIFYTIRVYWIFRGKIREGYSRLHIG